MLSDLAAAREHAPLPSFSRGNATCIASAPPGRRKPQAFVPGRHAAIARAIGRAQAERARQLVENAIDVLVAVGAAVVLGELQDRKSVV